jgi:HK97 family phage portal protein
MNILSRIAGWFGWGGALGQNTGKQSGAPSGSLISGIPPVGVDGALQISAVWSAVSRIAKTISTLPLMVYEGSRRDLARTSSLWQLFHESPNSRMTPCEFWIAMLLNLLFRGNAYARIDRDPNGEAYALWPMSADQVEMSVLDDGSVAYLYRLGANVVALAAENVLHLKEMGNGTVGLARLDYMKVTTAEAASAQSAANKLFTSGGKPTGVLMIDKTLSPDQRTSLQARFAEMAIGNDARLFLLEADMKYQQINMSPQDMQLLSTRQFTIQEIGRWFDVPAILMNQTEGTTTLGSSAEDIIDSFHLLTIRPALVSIEQAVRKRVLTAAQRSRYTVEFSQDAIHRANIETRIEVYSKAVQNGLKTRNECRQLENDPPIPGGDELTAQTNLAPLHMLGKIKPVGGSNGTQDSIAQ